METLLLIGMLMAFSISVHYGIRVIHWLIVEYLDMK